MASKQPNPNLWSIIYSVDELKVHEALWICAANERTAASKARRVLRARGERNVRLLEVLWEGTVDAF